MAGIVGVGATASLAQSATSGVAWMVSSFQFSCWAAAGEAVAPAPTATIPAIQPSFGSV